GLAGRGGERVRRYSKGMTQRLGLALALVNRPDLVLLDEPTSALDPVGRREVRELVRELAAAGVTVFLNSHLLTEVEAVCDRVAIVSQGRVVASGPLDDLAAELVAAGYRLYGLVPVQRSLEDIFVDLVGEVREG
ncbi:MAG TPA: ABC transporter ATP-binding protein, partial [Actinomycetota bacterium]|nr:ABC transporter ATP-binding protein [Actinomycetota bacterium]